MIAIQRGQPPLILQRLGQVWLNDLQTALVELNRLENDPSATEKQLQAAKRNIQQVQKRYNHKEIKQALVDLFHGKWAYCESRIRDVDYGHIEHFRPKSDPAYTGYTFEWRNLLLSCAICNDSQHKGINFPVDPQGQPLLLDPTEPKFNPELHFKFHWNLESNLATLYGRDPRGQETVHIFDLNGTRGRKDLLKERSQYVRKLLCIFEFAKQGNLEALSILQEALLPDAPYLAFARKYIEPELLTKSERDA